MKTHYVVNGPRNRVVAVLHSSLPSSCANSIADFLSVMAQEKHHTVIAEECPAELFSTSDDMLMTEITHQDVIDWADHVARESSEGAQPENISLLDIRLACAIQNIAAQTSHEEESAHKASEG